MKKILYICDQSPFEATFGSQQRSRLLLETICEKGNVDVVCFTSEPKPLSISIENCTIQFFGELPTKKYPKIVSRINKIFNIFFSFSPYSVYSKNKVAFDITHNLIKHNNYDYIVIRYIKNAFVCGLMSDKRIIIDVDDLPEQSILSYLETAKLSKFKILQYKFYALRATYHTHLFLKKIHHSFFPNKLQCKLANSSYLPNIPFPKIGEGNNLLKLNFEKKVLSILFVGYLTHSPNLEGVEYFLQNIWQKIKLAVPETVFKIAGKGITIEQKETWEKQNGVEILGFVENIHSEYAKCKVVVVPIYYGAGSNIKVLEAMSMQKASVITEFAAKPFNGDLINNENILIAKNNQDFADKVIQLLQDTELNNRISANAVKIINEKYSFSFFKESVNKYII